MVFHKRYLTPKLLEEVLQGWNPSFIGTAQSAHVASLPRGPKEGRIYMFCLEQLRNTQLLFKNVQ